MTIHVAVAARAGGVGKSSMVLNLAGAAVKKGLKPVCICLDYQGTILNLVDETSDYPFDVGDERSDATDNYDIAFYDYEAGDLDIQEDIIVTGFRAAKSGINSLLLTLDELKAKGIKHVIPYINEVEMHKEDDATWATQCKEKFGAHIIKKNGRITQANNNSITVFHPALNGKYEVGTVRAEYELVLDHILGVAHGN